MRYLFFILSFTLISASVFSQEKDSIYTIVEEMPRFPGCEDIKGTAEKKRCLKGKMSQYMIKNIQYPLLSEDNVGSKTIVASFLIQKDGCISNIEVVEGEDKRLNNAYAKVISEMPCWIPGQHLGQPVTVRFTLPTYMRLEYHLDEFFEFDLEVKQ